MLTFVVRLLVNNAGTGKMIPLTEVDYETIQRQFGANVYGPIFVTQAAVGLGKMPRGGRIINIGSVASKMGPAGLAIYGATKAAQDSLTASWARQVCKKTRNLFSPNYPRYTQCEQTSF